MHLNGTGKSSSNSANKKAILYHSPRSRSTRVVWLLEELGASVWQHALEIKVIHVSKGENRTPEYLTLSPSGKVPAYVEGDFVLTESGAIINYLLQKFGKFDEFAPRDIQQRAKYESWLLFTVGHLDPTLVPALNHIHHTPRDLQDTVMLAHKKKEFDEICIPAIESALRANDNLFVCGTSFTAADIVVMYSLRMAVRQGKLEVHPIFACLTYDQAESFGLA